MPRPGGNPLCVGKPGRSGRKSATEEHKDAKFVSHLWQEGEDVEALKEKVQPKRGRKVAARDVFALLCLQANDPRKRETALMKLADKLLPDLTKMDVGGEGIFALSLLIKEILDKKDD